MRSIACSLWCKSISKYLIWQLVACSLWGNPHDPRCHCGDNIVQIRHSITTRMRTEPLMRDLRQFEVARSAGDRIGMTSAAVKNADDAAAVIWTALPPDSSLKDRT